MAKCRDCGLSVSCGCSLIDGRCSACNYTYQQLLKEKKNVKIQTN